MADRREFLGTGWRFPIRPTPSGGFGWSGGEQKVAESIWLILSTALGERVMRPLVGCGVHDLLFAAANPATHAAVAHHAREALTEWEPRIDVLDVRVDPGGESGTTLLVTIDYRIRTNNAVHNLVYPLYAVEGELATSTGRV